MSLFCLQANRCDPKLSVLFFHQRVKTMPAVSKCLLQSTNKGKQKLHPPPYTCQSQTSEIKPSFWICQFAISNNTGQNLMTRRRIKKEENSTFSFNKKSKAVFLLLRNNRQTSRKQNDTTQTIRIMLNLATKLKVN